MQMITSLSPLNDYFYNNLLFISQNRKFSFSRVHLIRLILAENSAMGARNSQHRPVESRQLNWAIPQSKINLSRGRTPVPLCSPVKKDWSDTSTLSSKTSFLKKRVRMDYFNLVSLDVVSVKFLLLPFLFCSPFLAELFSAWLRELKRKTSQL